MNEIDVIEVGCSLEDGSYLTFYEGFDDSLDIDLSTIKNFILSLDLSKKGKIWLEENTKKLIFELAGTDDFGTPPTNLRIIFNLNGAKYKIGIPFSNSTHIYFELYDE